MTPLQALARAVAAGRAGQPLGKSTTDALATVLRKLQDGADPAVALGLPKKNGRPVDAEARRLDAQRLARVVQLHRFDGYTLEQAVTRALVELPGPSQATVVENHWRGKGDDDKVLFRKQWVGRLRKSGEVLAIDLAEEAATPPASADGERPTPEEDFLSDAHWKMRDKERRTTARGLGRLAGDYIQAARKVMPDNPNGTPGAPCYFLFSHALELCFKAFLRERGLSAKVLGNSVFGHDLRACYRAAKELRLKEVFAMTAADMRVLLLLADMTDGHRLRYLKTGLVRLPEVSHAEQFAVRLQRAVARLVGCPAVA